MRAVGRALQAEPVQAGQADGRAAGVDNLHAVRVQVVLRPGGRQGEECRQKSRHQAEAQPFDAVGQTDKDV